jgi:hypothetical protein
MKRQVYDPMLHDVELPLEAPFYPLGFGVKLLTNSQEVLAAAQESWGRYRQEFDRPPMVIRVLVRGESEVPAEPFTVAQEHLLSVIADRNNFAVADSKAMLAYCFASAKTVAEHAWFRWFLLEPMVYYLLTQRYAMPIHAACVAKHGRGILLTGASGAGKSTLSFACARAGWTFISDDATSLLQDSDDRVAIGKPHQARFRDDAARHFPELAGLATRARPNGKESIEIPMEEFPRIQTALHCGVEGIVFLERGAEPAELLPFASKDAVEKLLVSMPSYGEEVRLRHERTMSRLLEVPAYRLRYSRLEDAVELLEQLSEPSGEVRS